MALSDLLKRQSKASKTSKDVERKSFKHVNKDGVFIVVVHLRQKLEASGRSFYIFEFDTPDDFSDQMKGIDSDVDWTWIVDRYGNWVGIPPNFLGPMEIPSGKSSEYYPDYKGR